MREGTRASLPSPPLPFIAFFTSHRSPVSERLEQATSPLFIHLFIYFISLWLRPVGQNLFRTSHDLIGSCWPDALLFQSWGSLLVLFGLGLSIVF